MAGEAFRIIVTFKLEMLAIFARARPSFLDNHIDHHLGILRVVGDEQDAAASLEIGVVGIDRDLEFLGLARIDAPLVEAHPDAGVVHLQGLDEQRRLARVAQHEFAFHFLLRAERAERDVRAVDAGHRRQGQLRRRVEKIGQQGGRHVDLRILVHTVAHESAEVDVRLRHPHRGKVVAVECHEQPAHTSRTDYLGVGFGREVFGQVHQFGMVRLLAGIEDLQCEHGFVATVHIVELDVVGAQIEVAHFVGIFFSRFRLRHGHLSHDAQHVGLLVEVGVDSQPFVEVAEQFGIEGGGHLAAASRFDVALRPAGHGAAAVGAHAFDDE